MNYNEFIEEASKLSKTEMSDKTIHLKGYLSGDMEVICGYVSPDMVPSDELGLPTQYIISHTCVTVEDFEDFLRLKSDWMYREEVKDRIRNMIGEVKERVHELVGE
jgi:hypothetical protein